jgi:hypothetical protein
MDWRCGSSRIAPALQALNPDFKPQSHQKKKKRGEERKRKKLILGLDAPGPEFKPQYHHKKVILKDTHN